MTADEMDSAAAPMDLKDAARRAAALESSLREVTAKRDAAQDRRDSLQMQASELAERIALGETRAHAELTTLTKRVADAEVELATASAMVVNLQPAVAHARADVDARQDEALRAIVAEEIDALQQEYAHTVDAIEEHDWQSSHLKLKARVLRRRLFDLGSTRPLSAGLPTHDALAAAVQILQAGEVPHYLTRPSIWDAMYTPFADSPATKRSGGNFRLVRDYAPWPIGMPPEYTEHQPATA